MPLRSRRSRAAEQNVLARRAEALAAEHLTGLGYDILARNARVPGGELDVVARRGRLIVVCEVRARRDDTHISPLDTLDAGKQRRVRAAAMRWLAQAGLTGLELRFDAAAVVFTTPAGRLTYYEGAF